MTHDKKVLSNFLIFFFLTLIIVLDQLSKFWATKLGLLVTCNRGIAFGLAGGGVFVPLFVLLALLYFWSKQKNKRLQFAMLLVFAGGLSNLGDRIFVGCVRDFIKIGFWPAFNLADAAIIVGVVIILLVYLGAIKVKDV